MDGIGNRRAAGRDRGILNGREAIVINGVHVDLGTLGGKNSFTNYGGINDRGQLVGYCRNDAYRTRTAKTFAALAQNLHVVRFFGKTAT